MYCSFVSTAGKGSLYERYVEAVCIELNGMQSEKRIDGNLRTIFVGGGTPTVLAPELLNRILRQVREKFGLVTEAEVTIEANPGTVDESSLRKLRAVGFNRLSLGVQSLCAKELESLGRLHSPVDVYKGFSAARRVGFDNISLDLMYGLPGQSLTTWSETLEKALAMAPDHLSMYQLTVEENTPLHRHYTAGQIVLPDDETVVAMDELNVVECAAAGLKQYEISNYARPDHQCRHNLTYWRNESYLAAGAGAVSYIGGERSRRIEEPASYCEAMEQGRAIIEEYERLDPEATFRETVVMGLRLTQGVDRAALARRFGMDVETYYGKILLKLVHNGLIVLTCTHLALTRRGRRYANMVMAELV